MTEERPGTATVTLPAEYPKELEGDATLKDGTVIHLRPIRPDDAPGLVALFDRLSRHTAYQRFFSVLKRLPPAYAKVFANVDYRQRLAIVAELVGPAGSELVGVGRYEPADTPDGTPAGVPSSWKSPSWCRTRGKGGGSAPSCWTRCCGRRWRAA